MSFRDCNLVLLKPKIRVTQSFFAYTPGFLGLKFDPFTVYWLRNSMQCNVDFVDSVSGRIISNEHLALHFFKEYRQCCNVTK